jgi:hypothetical protein
MSVAIADAYRNIIVTTGLIGTPGTTTSTEVGGSLNIDAGFGISLVADAENNKITIVNTGNGTGALTTITDINSNATYYPIFTRAPGPGDINPITSTYQMDSMYLDQTTTPLTYNPSTGTITVINLVLSGNIAIGTDANFTDWPNVKMVSSQADTGHSHTYNIGVVGEAVGSSSDSSKWGVGIYGRGNTGSSASGSSATGVLGDGGVSNTADIQPAIGVRGYANDTHSGGRNIGLYGSASNSGVKNLALLMAAGDIESSAAQIWTLVDNTASALSIDATGKTGILKIVTTDAAEGVSMSGTLSVTGHVTVEGITSTGATGSGKFVFDNAPTISGHPTIEGITSTGATGSGKFVFDNAPTISGHPTIEGITSTGATGSGKFVFDNAPTISGHPTIEGITSTGATGTGKFVFDTSPTVTGISSNTVLVGANANFTRFPSAVAVVSTVAANQQNETGNIGLIAEAVGAGANRNAGLYGVGYTSGSFSCQGVVGEGHVSATGDTAPSVGIRGYANDTHAGGTNVGVYADATGSAIANYALYLNSGDIISASSKIWTLVDNTASALSFDAVGKTGILAVKTTDAAEGVTMSGTLSVTGNVGIGVVPSGTYKLQVAGSFAATTKSFLIDHPTKEGMKLRYGSLEGPENGVYIRGRLNGNNIIELPEYWTKLIDEDSITVNLTPIEKHQKLYVVDIVDNTVIIGNDNLLKKEINCFYTVFAERIDVEKLIVEIE